MEIKPYVYSFDDYISGKTNYFWLNAFDLYNNENLIKMKCYLKEKVNTRGDYTNQYSRLSSDLYNECKRIVNKILKIGNIIDE